MRTYTYLYLTWLSARNSFSLHIIMHFCTSFFPWPHEWRLVRNYRMCGEKEFWTKPTSSVYKTETFHLPGCAEILAFFFFMLSFIFASYCSFSLFLQICIFILNDFSIVYQRTKGQVSAHPSESLPHVPKQSSRLSQRMWHFHLCKSGFLDATGNY